MGQKFTVDRDDTLLNFLYRMFPLQGKTGVKKVLASGQVTIAGASVTAFDHPLRKGDTVVILPKEVSIARKVRSNAADSLSRAGVSIAYEDAHLLVVDKPSGLLTVSTGRGKVGKELDKREKTLYALLNDYIKKSAAVDRKEAIASGGSIDRATKKVWIVHRLDKGTSGLVLFAKDERTKDLLQSKWKELVLERTYTAFVEGCPEPEKGSVQSWLLEHPKSLKMHSYPEPVKDAQLAITHYKTLRHIYRRSKILYTQLEFSLQTGRKNQIRVHAADLGHPIAGDEKYGAETNPAGRLALHAATLVFRNPYGKDIIRLMSPLPEDLSVFEA
ncbi:MAG: RluA family pseudouridine synthase [Bacteroidales bacterium]|nr:RluA family pseudouridine synthase [Bacteroidales bacterium]